MKNGGIDKGFFVWWYIGFEGNGGVKSGKVTKDQ